MQTHTACHQNVYIRKSARFKLSKETPFRQLLIAICKLFVVCTANARDNNWFIEIWWWHEFLSSDLIRYLLFLIEIVSEKDANFRLKKTINIYFWTQKIYFIQQIDTSNVKMLWQIVKVRKVRNAFTKKNIFYLTSYRVSF